MVMIPIERQSDRFAFADQFDGVELANHEIPSREYVADMLTSPSFAPAYGRVASVHQASTTDNGHEVSVSAIKGGESYRANINGKSYSFYLVDRDDEKYVSIYTPTSSLGLFKVDRFDGALNPTTIRSFVDTNFVKPKE